MYFINNLSCFGWLTVWSVEKKEKVRKHTRALSHASSRQLSHCVGLSHASTYWEMCSFGYLYKISILQELKLPDGQHVAVGQWLLCFNLTPKVLEQVFFSDEAWFHLSGYINAQNFHICFSKNPHEYRVTSLHLQKISVWCTMSRLWIIIPFFNSNVNSWIN